MLELNLYKMSVCVIDDIPRHDITVRLPVLLIHTPLLSYVVMNYFSVYITRKFHFIYLVKVGGGNIFMRL